MPTTVVKTIIAAGGGDYTTLQAWEDAAPANLVTADQIWQGEVSGNISITSGVGLTVSGSTTDATRYKRLTTVAGASFRDNANVQTNALRVNGSNGAMITSNASYAALMTIAEDFFRIDSLQLEATNAQTTGIGVNVGGSGTATFDMDGCVCGINRAGAPVVDLFGSNCKLRNSLFVHRASSATSIIVMSSGASAYFCTFVVPSDLTAATYVMVRAYGTSTFKSCAFFGAGAMQFGAGPSVFLNCFTNIASPPSGCTTVAYDTTTGSGFQNTADATRDYRIKSTSALKDTGITDSTTGAFDIARTARPSGLDWDVGCWEFLVAAGTTRQILVGGMAANVGYGGLAA